MHTLAQKSEMGRLAAIAKIRGDHPHLRRPQRGFGIALTAFAQIGHHTDAQFAHPRAIGVAGAAEMAGAVETVAHLRAVQPVITVEMAKIMDAVERSNACHSPEVRNRARGGKRDADRKPPSVPAEPAFAQPLQNAPVLLDQEALLGGQFGKSELGETQAGLDILGTHQLGT